MDAIQKIMGLVDYALKCERHAEYFRASDQDGEAGEYKQEAKDLLAEIEAELRKLVCREPLSFKQINELESESGLDHYELVELVEKYHGIRDK